MSIRNRAMSLIIFLISLFLVHPADASDNMSVLVSSFQENEDLISELVPGISVQDIHFMHGEIPSDLSSIIWICFKGTHLFSGYNSRSNQVFLSFPCATGRREGQKTKVGDMRTPEGAFRVQQIQDASFWQPYVDKKTGETIGYGPYFIRVDTGKWKGIGIHGTDENHENEIGTNASHGCIRLKNDDLLRVKKLSRVGQKILILP